MISYTIKCSGCHRTFTWQPAERENEQPPNYHSRACQNRARIRRNAPSEAVGKCPHPFKRTWRTHQEAQAQCDRQKDKFLKPYRCECGALHIGHMNIKSVNLVRETA